jgi:lambda family phage portal protein
MIPTSSRHIQALAAETDPRAIRQMLTGTKSNRLEKIISYLSPGWALKRSARRQILAYSTGYKGADITTLRADWVTFGSGINQTPGGFELGTLRERSRDANRNHPVAAGASDTYAQNIVGSGIKPQSAIRAKVLGISDDRAKALRLQAEVAFGKFKPYAGADNRQDFDELQFLALAKIIEDGETIALPTWGSEPWRPYGRCIQLLESERLAQPTDKQYKNTTNGIRFGRRGEPLTYYIRNADEMNKTRPISAHDDQGRPRILHVFKAKRPGQQRGIPLFSPVLTYFEDLANYLEASLVAARVAACLAVFITQDDMYGTTGRESSTSGDTVHELSPGLISRLAGGHRHAL